MMEDRNQLERRMREAIELSLAGAGRVSPNPLVGAIVERGGAVLGQGCHERFGGPHAEVNALREAGDARGATLYVTLEPCRHHGKTPPCTDAILAAGVARVVLGRLDPNPKARGGADLLERAGVEVVRGVCCDECLRANAAYLKWISTGLPLVRLKSGATLDGRITGPSRRGERITGPESAEVVHRMRAEHDAVLVGAATVLADDPLLTSRPQAGPPFRQPLRVVLDPRLETPTDSRLLRSAGSAQPVLLLTLPGVEARRAAALAGDGVEVAECPAGSDGRLDLNAVLRLLGARSVLSVLVEPGAKLASALLRDGLADLVSVFVAPKLVGAQGLPMVGDLELGSLADAPILEHRDWRQVGDDLLLNGWLPERTWIAALETAS